MKNNYDADKIKIGVVGLGLMGSSIVTCLIIAGHPVVGVALPVDVETSKARIKAHLRKAKEEELVDNPPKHYLKRLTITEDYELLKDCSLVIETVVENLEIKKSV